MTDGSRLRLEPQAPNDDGIKIYATPDIAGALKTDLDDAGFETSWGLEHALGVDDAAIIAVGAVAAAGGLKGLASVLDSFFHRNQHRSSTVKADGEFTLTGMSKRETAAIAERCVERVLE